MWRGVKQGVLVVLFTAVLLVHDNNSPQTHK